MRIQNFEILNATNPIGIGESLVHPVLENPPFAI